jgi:hypothetical protein
MNDAEAVVTLIDLFIELGLALSISMTLGAGMVCVAFALFLTSRGGVQR